MTDAPDRLTRADAMLSEALQDLEIIAAAKDTSDVQLDAICTCIARACPRMDRIYRRAFVCWLGTVGRSVDEPQ